MDTMIMKQTTMIMNDDVEQIQSAIRLQLPNYRDLICPKCKEKPFIERSINNQGFLFIKCSCGLLNLSERGI